MNNNICLICNYRVGSTNTVKGLQAQGYGTNRWEVFGDARKIYPTADNINLSKSEHIQPVVESLKHGKNVYKLMGDQVNFNIEVIDQLSESSKFAYLYRADFEAQVKSWVAWLTTGDHNHHYGEDRTYKVDVTQKFFDEQADVLKRNYEFMEKVYQKYPGDILCLEAFPQHKPYNRSYDWSFEPQMNVTYDTSKLKSLHQ
jgi:hypothetical protein